jgi:hypothetical protein
LLDDHFLDLIIDEDGLLGQLGHSVLTHVGSIDHNELRVLLTLQDLMDFLELSDDFCLPTVVLTVTLETSFRLEDRKMEVLLCG